MSEPHHVRAAAASPEPGDADASRLPLTGTGYEPRIHPRAATGPSLRQARLVLVFAVVTVLACASLLAAAALVPAPPALLVVVIVVCVAYPMVAAYELSRVAGTFRARSELRRQLDELPETPHPLGL
jgi:hypothetical protein